MTILHHIPNRCYMKMFYFSLEDNKKLDYIIKHSNDHTNIDVKYILIQISMFLTSFSYNVINSYKNVDNNFTFL